MYQQHLQWRYILILEEFNKKWCLRQGALQRKVHINVHFVHISSFHPPTEERTECLWWQPLAILSLSSHLRRRQMYFHQITLRGWVTLSLAWHWIFCQCWSRWRSDSFQEAGRKTRSQIRLIQLKQFQRVSSPQQRSGPRNSHGTGTHRGRNQECVVCVQFCFYRWC